MQQDQNKTEVLFLIDTDELQNCFAFFPKERESQIDDIFNSYAHLGQHSACHIDYANECKQATKDEYNDLKNELESIGYNLTILNKN
jgi:hypothetical protein